MEIACGEYGDVVPKLVVAAQSVKIQNKCLSEMKPNNCDKSEKRLLQDGVNVDDIDMLSSGYSELLNGQKVDHNVEVNEFLCKTTQSLSSDETVVSSKPVGRFVFAVHQYLMI